MKSTAAAALLSGLAIVAIGFAQQDPLPQSAEKLLEHGQKNQEQSLYAEAERAFKAILEKFPQSDQAFEALRGLAQIVHYQTHRLEEARRWYGLLLEKYPKSPEVWEWKMCLAEISETQGQKEKALESYREIARNADQADTRTRGLQCYWRLQDKALSLFVNRAFTTGQAPVVQVQRKRINEISYRALRIEYASILPHLKTADAGGISTLVDRVRPEARTLIKEWTVKHTTPPQETTQDDVQIPATESGVYVLEATHDGLTVSISVLVGRFGLITKAAAGKLVCFVQDRATSRPVAGAVVHVLNGDRPFRGETDDRGLFVTAGFKGGLIAAVHEGELAFAASYYGEPEAEEAENRFYISTDRPIYRPGHQVHYRIVHRSELGRALAIRPGLKISVRITDPRNNPLLREVLTLNDFGSAEGSFVLGDSPMLGEYIIHARPVPKDPKEASEDELGWSWWESRGQFRVDEYRKPEFKVGVTYAKPRVLQGEKIQGTIHAEYYFGGAAEGADVRYRVLKARLPLWSWYQPYYCDWYDKEGLVIEEPVFFSPSFFGNDLSQGEGRTDRDGNLTVTIESTKDEEDSVYTIVAEVTDLSRRAVEGVGSCAAARAEFSLAMTLNKYVYKAGDRVGIKVRAGTPDGKPVPGTKIVLKAAERKWNGQGETKDALLFEGSSVTDDNGMADFSVAPEIAGGYLVLTAEAKDARGSLTKSETWAWLSGSGDWFTPRDLEGFTLTFDKKVYDLGDTAQILVQSQHKNVTLLFTIEGNEIYHREVLTLQGHAKLIEYKVTNPDLAPNAHVQVISIRGEAVLEAGRRMIVNPSRKFVNVEIKPDREEYRPRQKARYEIRTTGSDGKPVAAEVAVAIVDDSLFALQEEYEEDIRKFFIRPKWNEVTTSSSLEYVQVGHSARGGAPLTGATFALDEAKEAVGNRLAKTEVRSKFADTMSWKIVRTGADGRATVEVDIPDNLTTWRATARAITADSRFGQERRSVVSRKNVIVRLETPRFLTQNDASTLTAVVHNYLPAEKEFRIEFEATGVETQGDRVSTVRIPSGGQKRLDWKAVARDTGTARVRVKALGVEESDAMEVPLPILAHGSPRWESKAGLVEGRVVEKVTLPPDAIPGTAELVVAVSPVHASMVLDALDSLAGYPYGCVEQTMSKFLPSVIVAGTLKKLGLSRPALEKELPHMISAGLQRLYSMQHHDGGWGWWQQDQTNPWMTAYVLSGLCMAREAGVQISPDALSLAIASTRSQLGKSEDPDQEAYLLYALALADSLEEDDVLWRDYLTENLGLLKPYSQALLALVLHRENLDAKPVLRALAKSPLYQSKGHGWLDDGAEEAAAVLRAFLAIEPKDPIVPKIVQELGARRQGAWWRSTRQTAMVVYALTEYLARTGELNPDMTVSLSFNGRAIYSERITRATWPAFNGVRKFGAADLKPGENEIVIERQGAGSPTYALSLQYHRKGENLQASKGGLRIERTYSRIEIRNGARELRPLPAGARAVSGQEIEVTLTFTADQDYEWLMVEDPLPAGFEPVREYWGFWGWEWNYWYNLKEFHDDRVSMAMRYIAAGTHQASYTMRAETPGDYHALPARAFNMYFPELGGNSAESRIQVADNMIK